MSTSGNFRLVVRRISWELALQHLAPAIAPFRGDAPSHRSGKMSSSPLSSPSRMASATDSGEAFGTSRLRAISVSTGPAKTACTLTPRPVQRARRDCVIEKAAAFQIAYAGLNGTLANAANDRTLTMAP